MFEKQLNINQLLFIFTVYQINHLFIISSFILDNSRKKHCSHKDGKWGLLSLLLSQITQEKNIVHIRTGSGDGKLTNGVATRAIYGQRCLVPDSITCSYSSFRDKQQQKLKQPWIPQVQLLCTQQYFHGLPWAT